jgi:predicted regulator of Ras-like GTPase activity (Roadblock/LC7/MglB family)
MFIERLRQVAQNIDGVLALSLVAHDGVAVESVKNDPALDLDLLAAELMAQVRSIGQNHNDLGFGKVRQFTLQTDRAVLTISALTDDYFLMLAQAAGRGLGRARFELRRAILLFEDDLR